MSLQELAAEVRTRLSALIQRPRLEERLLLRPPFRYVRDIFLAVGQVTGFGDHVLDDADLVADAKPDKLRVLHKLISCLSYAQNQDVPVRLQAILAGTEVENTLRMLLMLANAAQDPVMLERARSFDPASLSPLPSSVSTPAPPTPAPTPEPSIDSARPMELAVPASAAPCCVASATAAHDLPAPSTLPPTPRSAAAPAAAAAPPEPALSTPAFVAAVPSVPAPTYLRMLLARLALWTAHLPLPVLAAADDPAAADPALAAVRASPALRGAAAAVRSCVRGAAVALSRCLWGLFADARACEKRAGADTSRAGTLSCAADTQRAMREWYAVMGLGQRLHAVTHSYSATFYTVLSRSARCLRTAAETVALRLESFLSDTDYDVDSTVILLSAVALRTHAHALLDAACATAADAPTASSPAAPAAAAAAASPPPIMHPVAVPALQAHWTVHVADREESMRPPLRAWARGVAGTVARQMERALRCADDPARTPSEVLSDAAAALAPVPDLAVLAAQVAATYDAEWALVQRRTAEMDPAVPLSGPDGGEAESEAPRADAALVQWVRTALTEALHDSWNERLPTGLFAALAVVLGSIAFTAATPTAAIAAALHELAHSASSDPTLVARAAAAAVTAPDAPGVATATAAATAASALTAEAVRERTVAAAATLLCAQHSAAAERLCARERFSTTVQHAAGLRSSTGDAALKALDAAAALTAPHRTFAVQRAAGVVLRLCAWAAHRFPERGSLETMSIVLSDAFLTDGRVRHLCPPTPPLVADGSGFAYGPARTGADDDDDGTDAYDEYSSVGTPGPAAGAGSLEPPEARTAAEWVAHSASAAAATLCEALAAVCVRVQQRVAAHARTLCAPALAHVESAALQWAAAALATPAPGAAPALPVPAALKPPARSLRCDPFLVDILRSLMAPALRCAVQLERTARAAAASAVLTGIVQALRSHAALPRYRSSPLVRERVQANLNYLARWLHAHPHLPDGLGPFLATIPLWLPEG